MTDYQIPGDESDIAQPVARQDRLIYSKERACPACIGTNGNHESGCYLAARSSNERPPRYVVYHTAGGYRRKPKWHVCDSADPRCSDPPPAIAVCYVEEHAERIIEALNANAAETRLCDCPPNCQGPDNTGKQCRAEDEQPEPFCKKHPNTAFADVGCVFCGTPPTVKATE